MNFNGVVDTAAHALNFKPPSWCRWAGLAACLFFIVHFYAKNFDPVYRWTALIHFGDTFDRHAIDKMNKVPHVVQKGLGYDGEFYATMALDPFLLNPGLGKSMDAPQYRCRRVLLPWISALAGAGNPLRTITIYSLLNGVFWIGLTVLLLFVFRPATVQQCLVCGVLLFGAGSLESLRLALTDIPAVTFITAALLVPAVWPFALGLSLFTRETSLIALTGFAFNYEGGRKVRIHFLKALVPVTLWGAWIAYEVIRFPGGVDSFGNIGIPFLAMLHRVGSSLYHMTFDYRYDMPIYLITALSFSVQALYFVLKRRPSDLWWRVGFSYVILFVCMGKGLWADPWGGVMRSLLPLTFTFNLMLSKASPREFLKWWVPGNLAIVLFIR